MMYLVWDEGCVVSHENRSLSDLWQNFLTARLECRVDVRQQFVDWLVQTQGFSNTLYTTVG